MSKQPSRRFLLPGVGQGNGQGYTNRPPRELPVVADPPDVCERIREASSMRDEPESIGPAVAEYADIARKLDALRRAHEVEELRDIRRRLAPEQRVADVQWRAKRQHIDVSNELFVIRKLLDRGKVDNALRRIEQVEARVDQAPDAAAIAAAVIPALAT